MPDILRDGAWFDLGNPGLDVDAEAPSCTTDCPCSLCVWADEEEAKALPRYILQRLQYGTGVNDICGTWLSTAFGGYAVAGTPGRYWRPGLTLAEATEYVESNERLRASNPRIPPRRIVLMAAA